MIGTYLKKLVKEAVAEAMGLLPEQRLSAERLRGDLDTMVLHGVGLQKLADELYKYSHENIHALRNVTTGLQLLLDNAQMAINDQERMIAELKSMIQQDTPIPPSSLLT
jgi:hypothetical protein